MIRSNKGMTVIKGSREDAFADFAVVVHSLTSIATCIVVLKRNRDTTDIIFENEGRIEKISVEAIKENDFILSVSIYIQEESEKEEIDASVLESEARRLFLIRLKKELDFDKMVCEIEGISMKPFISAIRKVLREYDNQIVSNRNSNQISLFDIGMSVERI